MRRLSRSQHLQFVDDIRDISDRFSADGNEKSSAGLSNMVWGFGQFVGAPSLPKAWIPVLHRSRAHFCFYMKAAQAALQMAQARDSAGYVRSARMHLVSRLSS